MSRVTLPLQEIMAIAATRGMLGAGMGLLIADRIKKRRRKTLGLTLLAIGVISTIPLAADVLGRRKK